MTTVGARQKVASPRSTTSRGVVLKSMSTGDANDFQNAQLVGIGDARFARINPHENIAGLIGSKVGKPAYISAAHATHILVCAAVTRLRIPGHDPQFQIALGAVEEEREESVLLTWRIVWGAH